MPLLRPFGVSGAPTNTHLRKPVGSFTLPSGKKTAVAPCVWAAPAGVVRTEMLPPINAMPAMAASRDLYITEPPSRFEPVACTCCSLHAQNRITVDVNPVRFLCGDVAAEAVLLEVGGDLRVGRVGFEERPAPPVPPQWIAREAAFAVLDHHEPDRRPLGPVRVAGGQPCVTRGEHVLHEHGSIGKPFVLAIELRGPRRRVRVMHLVAFRIEHRVHAEHLITIPIV